MKSIFFVFSLAFVCFNTFIYAQGCVAPYGNSTSSCGGSITLSATSYGPGVSGHSWYTSQTGGYAISGVTQFSPTTNVWVSQYPTTLYATTTYWVSAMCGGSESARTSVTFTLNSGSNISITPSGNPTNACQNNGFTLTAGGGTNYAWFLGDPNSGGVSLGSASVVTPTQSGYYYLRGTTSCNKIQTTLIPVTLIPIPTSPIAANVRCKYNGKATLTASGATGYETYYWYNSGQSYLGSGNNYLTSALHTQTTTYYVAKFGSCAGPKVAFQVLVNSVPIADAGPDVTLALPRTACYIYGGAADVDADLITYQWTKISGPAVTINTASASTLSLSGLVAGVYVFRLNVTDVMGDTGFDDVILTVGDFPNNYNYIKTENIKVKGVKSLAEVSALSETGKNAAITYFDGQGRTLENVLWRGSPLGKDVMTPAVYDEVNRQTTSYLPVVYPQNSGDYQSILNTSGEYTGSVATFYGDKPMAKTKFETSPLSRPTESGSVGSGWQLGTSGSTKISYSSNVADEFVDWTITTASVSTGLPSSTLKIGKSLLTITTTVSGVSNSRTTTRQSVKTAFGLNIAQREKLDATTWAETYYVYDEFDKVRFIIPPALMKILTDGQSFKPTEDQVNKWCFQYRYDYRHRLIASKSPGAAWKYFIYDKRDRIVLTQDGNQRVSKSWTFTKYDYLDRAVIGGIYAPSVAYTLESMQTVVDGIGGGGFQNVSDATFSSALTSSTSDVFPQQDITNLSISYYDQYTGNPFFQDPAYQFTAETWKDVSLGEPFAKFDRVRGQLCGSSEKILGSTQWLNSVVYYDQYQAPIQIISSLHVGGASRTSTLHDFEGKVLETKTIQSGQAIARRFTYDHAGRILKTHHQINAQPEVVLSSLEYNELGQVVDKKIHSADNGSSYLQSIDYTYDIHGWLTAINSAAGTGDPNDYFALELGYDANYSDPQGDPDLQLGNTPRKDGLISTARWRQDLQSKNQRVYNFTYDNLNRLGGADYKSGDGTSWNNQVDYFSEKGVTYDLNGNITKLKRYSYEVSPNGAPSFGLSDDLSYGYGTGGNQLMAVSDIGTTGVKDRGFKDGNTTGDDYTYDVNGNLTRDKNKNFTITYNYLNLPNRITFGVDNSYMQYTYDASGAKLSQAYYNASNVLQVKTDYVGEVVYTDNVPALIFHEEGRLVPPSYTNLITNREANSTEGFAGIGASISSASQNGQSYVKATSTQATGNPGVLPIGGGYPLKKKKNILTKYSAIGKPQNRQTCSSKAILETCFG